MARNFATRPQLQAGGNFEATLPPRPTLAEVNPDSYRKLEKESTDGIQQNVVNAAGARWDKALVKFVKTSRNKSGQQTQRGPTNMPSLRRRPCSAPGEEGKSAQQSVTAEMGCFPHKEVDLRKTMVRDWPVQGMNDSQQNASRMLGGKRIGGKKKDQTSPRQRRPPRLYHWRQEPARRQTVSDLAQFRCGPRIAPRLLGQGATPSCSSALRA